MDTVETPVRAHIRWMILRDMPEVVAIAAASSVAAWTADDFLRYLRQRNCIGMAVEQSEKVVGFVVYELHKNKLEIANFAVHPDFRRQRIGTQIVEKLISKLTANHRISVSLYVRETSLPTLLFLQKLGFRATKSERRHYADTGEDAIRMVWRLPPEEIAKAEATATSDSQHDDEDEDQDARD